MDCLFPFTGLFETKLQSQHQPVPIPPTILSQRPASIQFPAPGRPRTSCWYSCSWCEKEYKNPDLFVDCSVKYLVHESSNCGKGNSISNTKTTLQSPKTVRQAWHRLELLRHVERCSQSILSTLTCYVDIFGLLSSFKRLEKKLPQIRDFLVKPIPVPTVQ
ncbi:hypothetical protein CRE_17039 [Caenorhabditis remanei]|uniref:Uncharacterized protein n=1 Tax=Caenorhabditis remanei TaxID=31234 RepID=E3M9U8_CAERE|nr:hypothetical protein CRE_17039 [Caenorhabditis remanei]